MTLAENLGSSFILLITCYLGAEAGFFMVQSQILAYDLCTVVVFK